VLPDRDADLHTSANSSRITVLVSVKINDGVVMAADSASSFESGMVYQNADKIVNFDINGRCVQKKIARADAMN
jgi:20S proteasome alpha/beta subunit